eukprot:TRINITY_DN25424_c0_g1_i1.p1 TRINITY_DN25424_c0_g1~~TRINITY_DN25424_c0_g1_i1.p1  ORF type:complete len:332 (+),score=43.76 TRINITY_DN25424_c0_g1_i1:55-1050(+)
MVSLRAGIVQAVIRTAKTCQIRAHKYQSSKRTVDLGDWPPPPTVSGDDAVAVWVRRRVGDPHLIDHSIITASLRLLVAWMLENSKEKWFGLRTYSAMLSQIRKENGRAKIDWIMQAVVAYSEQLHVDQRASFYDQALRTICSRAENLTEAVRLVEIMSNNYVLPSARTHTEILRLYCKLGKTEQVFDTYRTIVMDYSDTVYLQLATEVILKSGLLNASQIRSIFDLVCGIIPIQRIRCLFAFFQSYQAADPTHCWRFISEGIETYIRNGGVVDKTFKSALSLLKDTMEVSNHSLESLSDIIKSNPVWIEVVQTRKPPVVARPVERETVTRQ